MRTQTLLGAGRPTSWSGGVLTVEVAGPMRSVVEHRREEIESLLRRAAGRKVSLEVCASEVSEEGPRAIVADPVQMAREHPLVRQAMELFGGRVDTAYFKKKQ